MIRQEIYHEPIIEECTRRWPELCNAYQGVQLGLAFGRAEQMGLALLVDGFEPAISLGEACTEDAIRIFLGVAE